MLRAVIEHNGHKAYFDFCGPWEKFEKAVLKMNMKKAIYEINLNDVNLHITKAYPKIYSKLHHLIQPTDCLYVIYDICKKLQYDNIDFKDKFLNDYEQYHSIHEVDKAFTDYSHKKLNEKDYIRFKDPNQLRYEPMKLFGKKVLFTDERIDMDKFPKGIYRYELRENNGNICEISDKIFVDFYGTILSYKPIVLNSDGYRDIDEGKDVEYSLEPGNLLEQYMIELEFTKSYRLIQ